MIKHRPEVYESKSGNCFIIIFFCITYETIRALEESNFVYSLHRRDFDFIFLVDSFLFYT